MYTSCDVCSIADECIVLPCHTDTLVFMTDNKHQQIRYICDECLCLSQGKCPVCNNIIVFTHQSQWKKWHKMGSVLLFLVYLLSLLLVMGLSYIGGILTLNISTASNIGYITVMAVSIVVIVLSVSSIRNKCAYLAPFIFVLNILYNTLFLIEVCVSSIPFVYLGLMIMIGLFGICWK